MRALVLCGFLALTAIPAWAQNRSQQIEDARALLSQEWKTDLALIEAMASAERCSIITSDMSKTDTFFLTIGMKNKVISAGLFGDPIVREVDPLAQASRTKGFDESNDSFCRSRWQSPVDRAEFRRMAQEIMANH